MLAATNSEITRDLNEYCDELEHERDVLQKKLYELKRGTPSVQKRTVGTETDESYYSVEECITLAAETPGVRSTPRKLRFADERPVRRRLMKLEARVHNRD